MNDIASNSSLLIEIEKAIRLAEAGDFVSAERFYNTIAVKLTEDNECRARFGLLCMKLKNSLTAVAVFKKLCDNNPENIGYLSLLGAAYIENGQPRAAEKVLSEAAQGGPLSWAILTDLGNAKILLRKYGEAAEIISEAISLKPSHENNYVNLIYCLVKLGRHAEVVDVGKKALSYHGSSSLIHKNIGGALMELGNSDEAAKYFEKAIKLNKLNGGAYLSLSGVKKFSEKDLPLVKRIEKLLEGSMPAKERSYLNFALGKIYNDLSDWDAAFRNLRKANMIGGTFFPEEASFNNLLGLYKKFYTPKVIESALDSGHTSQLPVFIVGMPRSGTTLIEQIIDRHSKAFGAGELTEIQRLSESICQVLDHKSYSERWAQSIRDGKLFELGAEYLEMLSNIAPKANVVTDKMPENYFYLGFISLAFPKARIIHAQRDPLDTCFSCYLQAFEGLSWSYDLEKIGERYVLYRQMMEFWRSVLPRENILEVRYEEVVSDPERMCRKIIEHCGLEWEPQCLDHMSSERTVSTASHWQVRQPIYKTSVKRWHNYVEHLEPLLKKIAQYLDDEDIELIRSRGIKISRKSWWKF